MSSAVAKALVTARQKCLTEDEAYWDPRPDFTRPVSSRNEAAALSWLLDHQAVVCRGGRADVEELQALCASYCARLGVREPPEQQRQHRQYPSGPQPAAEAATAEGSGAVQDGREAGEASISGKASTSGEASTSGRTFAEASAEAALQRWCVAQGVKGTASPALFEHGGVGGAALGPGGGPPPLRGLRADSDVAPGEVVLHVPADVLISYETAKESDLGKVLTALPLGLGDDSIALIWTCVERREPESAHAAFWAALPERFTTVLSAPDSEVALLEGTPLYGEATRARQHLREAFDSSSPAFRSLLAAYPDYFKPEWFSWEAYLWAAELWYSYGIQVQLAAGDIRTCLAPYLGLMNHHPLPHVVHFSKVDPQTGCLRVRAFRPCAAGRQLFLSYGPYPNGKLLLFYGFALPDNPVDEVDLQLQMPPGPTATDRRALLAAAGLSLEHRLRAGGRLAPPLLATARLLAAAAPLLKQLRALPPAELKMRLAAPAAPDVEAAALQLVAKAIEGLLRPAVACLERSQPKNDGGAAGGAWSGGVGDVGNTAGAFEGQAKEAVSASAAAAATSAAPASEGLGGVARREGCDGGCGGAGGAGNDELRHFMRVYVAGAVRVLDDSLCAARGVGRPDGASGVA